jgi:phenylacetate-CoA ligase
VEAWTFPPSYDDSYRPPPDQPHWFPERETMDPGARDARILERLKEVCAYAYERSPFYRAKWGSFEPGDLKTFEDFERLPVIEKNELRADQAAHPPFGSYTCIEPDEVVRIHGTSGTTGRPTAFGIGAGDWRAIANAHARIMWAMGIRPGDTVFIGSVFSL